MDNATKLHRMQTAMFLDDLPKDLLTEIEKDPTNIEHTKTVLKDYDLSSLFRESTTPEDPLQFVAFSIMSFFLNRKIINL